MGIHREVFQVHGTFCSYCKPRCIHTDMDSELENSKDNKEKHSMWQSQEARKHGNSAGRGVMKRTGTNKADFSIVRHQKHVVD